MSNIERTTVHAMLKEQRFDEALKLLKTRADDPINRALLAEVYDAYRYFHVQRCYDHWGYLRDIYNGIFDSPTHSIYDQIHDEEAIFEPLYEQEMDELISLITSGNALNCDKVRLVSLLKEVIKINADSLDDLGKSLNMNRLAEKALKQLQLMIDIKTDPIEPYAAKIQERIQKQNS